MLAVVIEITSYLHHVTPTKYENRETIETKDTCFWEERFIDRSFLLLEILKAEILWPPPPPPPPPPQPPVTPFLPPHGKTSLKRPWGIELSPQHRVI